MKPLNKPLWQILKIKYTDKGIKSHSFAAQRQLASISSWTENTRSGHLLEDKSGDRLREWLGVDEDTFYNSGLFAVIPMDFYFPGHGKSVTQLHPRKGFAGSGTLLLKECPDID